MIVYDKEDNHNTSFAKSVKLDGTQSYVSAPGHWELQFEVTPPILLRQLILILPEELSDIRPASEGEDKLIYRIELSS